MTRAAPLQADIAAVLDWWRGAGVDAVFADEAKGWLAEVVEQTESTAPSPPKTAQKPAPPPPELPKIGGPLQHWPRDLAAFRNWWLAESSLDEGGLAPRIAPSGEADAELMVLVAMPEVDDRDRLLSGVGGALVESLLAAAGLAPEQVYRAAVLPRHTPLADWSALASQGLGDLLAHHVMLARPKRLLVLGRNILPLCGHDPAQGAQKLRCFNHEGGRVPALAEAGLERLLGNWQLRARLWKRWLDWTDGQSWDERHG